MQKHFAKFRLEKVVLYGVLDYLVRVAHQQDNIGIRTSEYHKESYNHLTRYTSMFMVDVYQATTQGVPAKASEVLGRIIARTRPL